MPSAPLVVWAFTDGKAGHENQTRGLLKALAHRFTIDARWIRVPAYAAVLSSLMTRRFLPGAGLPPPDLLIGAGHRTHLPLLAARRAFGGRAVVLMKPSLPRVWFDLCVVPEHDEVSGANVLVTRGVLNPIEPAEKGAPAGLILVGGPSRHHRWAEHELITQIETIVARSPEVRWTLTTSRRTPPTTSARLQALTAGNLAVVPVSATGPGWLPQQLAGARYAWVSEDSVSMVYEALSAGCATGLIGVPARRASRITRGIELLVRDRLVTPFGQWQAGGSLAVPAQSFNEAARVADWIASRWLSAN